MHKIHVGYPKTATTYLQRHVFPQLKEHHFISHQDFHRIGLNDLIWKAERSVDYAKIQERLPKEEHLFISFENLIGPLFKGSIMIDFMPERLKKVFGTNNKILLTLRKQSDMLKSIYVQYVQQGGGLKCIPFFENTVYGNNCIDFNAFNYNTTYDLYAEHFGAENIVVIPYELLASDTASFFENLSNFFGEELTHTKNKQANRSLSGNQLKMLRLINKWVHSRMSENYIIPKGAIDQDKLRFRWQQSNFLRFGRTFSHSEASFIDSKMDLYAASNRLLDQKIVPNLKELGYF